MSDMVGKIDEISSSDSSLREFLKNKETLDYCYAKYKGNNSLEYILCRFAFALCRISAVNHRRLGNGYKQTNINITHRC